MGVVADSGVVGISRDLPSTNESTIYINFQNVIVRSGNDSVNMLIKGSLTNELYRKGLKYKGY